MGQRTHLFAITLYILSDKKIRKIGDTLIFMSPQLKNIYYFIYLISSIAQVGGLNLARGCTTSEKVTQIDVFTNLDSLHSSTT